jgi:alkylation response protein AidB-like acyl-CoA dehydrogenase
MAKQIESVHAWIEQITYQFTVLNKKQQIKLGGSIALLKVQATRTLAFCASEAVQILGGAGYTRGGQGEKVERIAREVKAYAIPGGSEEIMLDLGMRQAMRTAKL